MAYVYRHIRLDKNIPFYIGIGSDEGGKYVRAFKKDKRNRNSIWNNIVSKTYYEVEILFDNITWDEACNKEIEFISLYKRIHDGGILANMTKGGDGSLGVVFSKETCRKLSIALKGKNTWSRGRVGPRKGVKLSEETKKKLSESHKGIVKTVTQKKIDSEIRQRFPILQFDLQMNFIKRHDSLRLAAKSLGINSSGISEAANGKRKQRSGFIWRFEQKQPKNDVIYE